MAFCAKCGAEISGAFCPQCGAPAGGAPPAAPGPGSSGSAAGSGLEDHVAAALCYVTIIPAILFLLIAPYNRNGTIRFNAFQCLFLNAAFLVFWVGVTIITVIVSVVSLDAIATLIGLVSWVIWLGGIVLWFYIVLQTYSKKKVVLPIIGPLAEKQAG